MRTVLLAWFLLCPAVAWSQAPGATAESAVVTVTGSAFALSVADLEASTRWYADKLGLRVVAQIPRTEASRAAVTVLQGGGLTVELVRHDDAVPLAAVRPANQDAVSIHGVFKVGVTVDDFDRTLADLRSRGIDIAYGPFPKRPDQPANVIIRDNAGNLIQISGR